MKAEYDDALSEGWIDVSCPLKSGMVHWPKDPQVRIDRIKEIENGNSSNLLSLVMGSHAGTHVDAPLHFLQGGASVDRIPLESCIGRARVVELRNRRFISDEDIVALKAEAGERLIFKTDNFVKAWLYNSFYENYVYLSVNAARLLAESRVRMVGIDYLSIGGNGEENRETHNVLLRAGILIVEGLQMSAIEQGNHEVICLPLRIQDGDGAPARVLLRSWPR